MSASWICSHLLCTHLQHLIMCSLAVDRCSEQKDHPYVKTNLWTCAQSTTGALSLVKDTPSSGQSVVTEAHISAMFGWCSESNWVKPSQPMHMQKTWKIILLKHKGFIDWFTCLPSGSSSPVLIDRGVLWSLGFMMILRLLTGYSQIVLVQRGQQCSSCCWKTWDLPVTLLVHIFSVVMYCRG